MDDGDYSDFGSAGGDIFPSQPSGPSDEDADV